MTYLALARKWRPKIFNEVMGQTHVVKALSNALNSGRVHHAFLFTGTRGVGKTTLARIFAKSLNCEQGMSANPCGECSICRNIDQGSFIDLIEVDAASRTGIDDMRELLDNIQYAPTQGRFKVYLIDEIHMLSKSSFNALLKTLEEPPEHVKFLFATTDPQKLPVTVLSRCLQFNLKALQPDEIGRQIMHILQAEEIPFDEGGVQLIARAADGSLRDALSLLEQAIAQGGGAIDAESVRSMLGTVKAGHMDALLEAIIRSDVESALATVQDMANYAADFSAALDQLLIELHTIALAQATAEALAYKVTDVEKYLTYAQQISADDVQLCYQIALIAKRDLALAPDYRSGFEMAVLRVIAFKPVDGNTQAVPQQSNANTVSNTALKSAATEKTPQQAHASEVVMNSVEQAKESSPMQDETPKNVAPAAVPVATPSPMSNQEQSSAQPTETITPNNREIGVETHQIAPQVTETSAPAIPLDSQHSIQPSVQQSNQQNTQQNSQQNTQYDSLTDDSRREPSKPQLNHAQEVMTNHASGAQQAPELPHQAVPAQQVVDDYAAMAPSFEPTPVVTAPSGPSFASPELNSSPEPHHSPEFNNHSAAQNVVDEDDPYRAVPAAPHTEWAGFVEQLQLNGLVRELAYNMACADIQAEPMRLSLDPNFQYMKNATREAAIIDEIRKLRGTNYQVQIVVETTVHETPAERMKRLQEEQQQNTLQQVKDDPTIQSVMQTFDLSIDESNIKPK